MEDERKGKPVTLIGGMYAKAKQRVLNKMGRRTTLTRNPRVDFISKRVEDIKTKKTEVTNLANSAKSQLKTTRKTLVDLDRAMLNAYIGELGERRWDEEKGTYARVLHPEEKRLVADMERVLSRCMETMDRVFDSFIEHLDDTARKPLTFHTPEEDVKLAQVMQTKEEYKTVRTLYSDAMIDADADLAAGADLSPAKKEKVEETQEKYKEMSERLCEDAIKYEEIYREELAQRVTSHFTAEQQLLRGVSTAMKEFFPYTRGLTLNWEDMRATRRANLAAAKRGAFDEEDEPVLNTTSSLPEAGPFASSSGLTGESSSPKNSNPFSNITSTASGAAAAVARQMTAKNVSNIIAQYAPGKKTSTKPDGLDKIKL